MTYTVSPANGLYTIVDVSGAHIATTASRATAARLCALLQAGDAYAGPQPLACPKCGGYESNVDETRVTDRGIRRRRICAACHTRFATLEIVHSLLIEGEDV